MKKLTMSSFVRSVPPGSFGHLFTHKLDEGGEICLESCMEGYCVGRYDKNLDLLGEKKCTRMGEEDEALNKAIGFANEML